MQTETRANLTKYAWLSIGAAVVTIGLKAAAYWVTGSVGLLSDALESLVNLAGAVMALGMLTLAAAPPDEEHAYGHTKAEYFSSVIEGVLILLAAGSIAYTAIKGLINPQPIEAIGLGLAVSVLASIINLGVAQVLQRAARRHNSASLEANAQHLMTDVWTSAGVLAAVGLVALSGWQVLDPIVALAVAANITYSGIKIVRTSAAGLLDTALPPEQLAAVRAAIEATLPEGAQYHALRTRQSGVRSFVSLHVLVPGGWTVVRGHRLLERVEAAVRAALSGHVTVFTHLESIGDVASYEDEGLDRIDARISDEVNEDMESFEEFWVNVTNSLEPGKVIKNWTADSGFIGEDFTIAKVAKDAITFDPPQAIGYQVVPKNDFLIIWKVWDKYLNGELNRSDLRNMSRYSKYIISSIHSLGL